MGIKRDAFVSLAVGKLGQHDQNLEPEPDRPHITNIASGTPVDGVRGGVELQTVRMFAVGVRRQDVPAVGRKRVEHLVGAHLPVACARLRYTLLRLVATRAYAVCARICVRSRRDLRHAQSQATSSQGH